MSKVTSSKLSRRQLMMAGAGTVGALAAAAVLPLTPKETSSVTPEAKDAPNQGGGYQVTQHVLRYYQTARV